MEYFIDEVGLKSVPKGDWFCSKCTTKTSKELSNTKQSNKKTVKADIIVSAPARRTRQSRK